MSGYTWYFVEKLLACVAASSNCQQFLPVSNAAREGLHPGEATMALVNNTPSFATLSNAGVEIAL
jgi:hypothetical protein